MAAAELKSAANRSSSKVNTMWNVNSCLGSDYWEDFGCKRIDVEQVIKLWAGKLDKRRGVGRNWDETFG